MWYSVPSGNIALMFYLLQVCSSFCDNSGKLACDHGFLLQTKSKKISGKVSKRNRTPHAELRQIWNESGQPKNKGKCTIGQHGSN